MNSRADMLIRLCSILFPVWDRARMWSFDPANQTVGTSLLLEPGSSCTHKELADEKHNLIVLHIPTAELTRDRLGALIELTAQQASRTMCSKDNIHVPTDYLGSAIYNRYLADFSDTAEIKPQAVFNDILSWPPRAEFARVAGRHDLCALGVGYSFSYEAVVLRTCMEALPVDSMAVILLPPSNFDVMKIAIGCGAEPESGGMTMKCDEAYADFNDTINRLCCMANDTKALYMSFSRILENMLSSANRPNVETSAGSYKCLLTLSSVYMDVVLKNLSGFLAYIHNKPPAEKASTDDDLFACMERVLIAPHMDSTGDVKEAWQSLREEPDEHNDIS